MNGAHETPSADDYDAYALLVQPWPGLSSRQQRELEPALAEYLDERELFAEGATLRMTVRARSPGRELAAADAVELIAWLLAQPAVCGVRLGCRARRGAAAAPVWASASHADLAVAPALELHRLGRLDARAVLQVLRLPSSPVWPPASAHAAA